ncbi:S24/S26 family peptidase [Halobacterium noricense]|uniref:S24/S26 family peptidase n=1 Tax=Halobacterium noricense TaxID=223182 RepID=UPI0038CBF5DF
MEPVIDSCDILVVDKTQDTISEVESGDIIAYESIDGNLIAHKFYTTAGLPNELKYIVAKGVNRSSVDRTPIYNEDLVGKVSRVYDLPFC